MIAVKARSLATPLQFPHTFSGLYGFPQQFIRVSPVVYTGFPSGLNGFPSVVYMNFSSGLFGFPQWFIQVSSVVYMSFPSGLYTSLTSGLYMSFPSGLYGFTL
jgi:hypothetical protein